MCEDRMNSKKEVQHVFIVGAKDIIGTTKKTLDK